MSGFVFVRGGGDLASGVVLRLAHVGMRVLVLEIDQPLAVRRTVSFAQAVYDGQIDIEDVTARRVSSAGEAAQLASSRVVPVLVDPSAEARHELKPLVIVDARMTKHAPDLGTDAAEMTIGLGPGFIAGDNCHAVVETMRGPFLGRVYWSGTAADDTGLPETVSNHQADRVLRAPRDGLFEAHVAIGDLVEIGQILADVGGQPMKAVFPGVVRGMLQSGLQVKTGLKVGDIDPRNDPRLSRLISEKALAIGGGVLEAILSRADLRGRLWD